MATLAEVYEAVLKFCPNATMEEDLGGYISIATNMLLANDDVTLIEDDEEEH